MCYSVAMGEKKKEEKNVRLVSKFAPDASKKPKLLICSYFVFPVLAAEV